MNAFNHAKHDQAGLLSELSASESIVVRLIALGYEAISVAWFDQLGDALYVLMASEIKTFEGIAK